ncbi:hypothetical protein [Streptomyces sp. NPDC021020]|uniref:hypothetical protein n=1 Tax=Streptomyces sp. NPDC021020 TaxID=3365109 RepID=UPI0037AD0FFF
MEKITPDHLLMSTTYQVDTSHRHDALAPKIAFQRWQAVQDAIDKSESLYDRWYELSYALEDARQEALAASAKAHAEGKNAPAGTAAKVFQAELDLNGCFEAFRASRRAIVTARKPYDALWEDPAFLAAYRETVAAEFVKRREAVRAAFAELDGNLAALGSLYGSLGDLTLNGLLRDDVSALTFDGKPIEHSSVFLAPHRSWTAPKLAEAMSEVRRFVRNDDPVTGGTLLAGDLDDIANALPELADKRYDEWQDELTRTEADRYGVIMNASTGRRTVGSSRVENGSYSA